MKKLAIVFAVSAAALMGGSSAFAADNALKSKPSTDAAQSCIAPLRRPTSALSIAIATGVAITTAIAIVPPSLPAYYGSYNYYAPRPYGYYGPRYYGGGPGVTFSFGSGGYRGW